MVKVFLASIDGSVLKRISVFEAPVLYIRKLRKSTTHTHAGALRGSVQLN